MSTLSLTEMWETFIYLKNLQLLKSKVDSLESSDLRDQLLLELERHQSCLSIYELPQISSPELRPGSLRKGPNPTTINEMRNRNTDLSVDVPFGISHKDYQISEVKRKCFGFGE